MGSKGSTTPWTINTLDPVLAKEREAKEREAAALGKAGTKKEPTKAEPLPINWAGDWKFMGY